MESDKQVHVLTIKFDSSIKRQEVPLFRGAVNVVTKDAENVLFHNHERGNYRYSYPLIQYKRIGGKATIIGINEGADTLLSQTYKLSTNYKLGDRNVKMEIASMEPATHEVKSNQFAEYKLWQWLPLNGDNYHEYNKTRSLRERVIMLEKILKGNIISLAKGLGVHIDYDIVADITDITSERLVTNKGTKLMAFDIKFISNVSIPNNIGLGKSASVGYGVVERLRDLGKILNGIHEAEAIKTTDGKKDTEAIHEVEKPVFLLGGKDLEMNTINNILINHCCIVYDKELSWKNAVLSAYTDEIKEHKQSVIYGIELKQDMDAPDRYIAIDHHNGKRNGPSAIEQVAEVLGATMSRFHQLVAANDKGYIPGMKEIGATDKEVFNIRHLDRKAQGVTEDEEEAAEADISKAENIGRLTIVTTSLQHFSPIVDKMYPYGRLLVLADNELTYYGDGIDRLRDELSDICNDIYYGGGGDVGYIGIPQTSPDIYNKVKNKIIEIKRC